MRFRKLLLILVGSLLVVGLLGVLLTPLLVARGLRLWMARSAEQAGLRVEIGKIDAPFLRPVIITNLQITSPPDAVFQVKVEAPRVELALDFAAIVNQSPGRFLRSLKGEAVGVDIRRNPNPSPAAPPFDWRILEYLLADNLKFTALQLHIENGETVIDLQDGTLSGAQIEAGVFSANEITIAAPGFRKTFSQLRGATSWQGRRFTIGALTLTRGLDLDAVSIDLSHLAERQLGLEMAMDAFGGKLRARISSEDHGDQRTWDVAGSASEISLAQMSEALDLADHAAGSLRACKFTFRGEANNLREAAATIWAEVTGLTWRDRTADTIMIGASLYNRQVHVEQLFVKQRNNQFNLSGESALPQKWADWLNPDFHGDIVASINDLGDFARLFGASASDFAGKIDIAGNVSARERKLAGQLSVSGHSLTLLRAPFESLSVELSLKESRLEIANFELRRENDSFSGQASLDLAGERKYSFNFVSALDDMADYAALLPEPFQSLKLGGSLDLNWAGMGTETTHSGTFHAQGHDLHLPESSFAPFDGEFEGDYSPDTIFFRQFNLTNKHAAFNAFLTVAKDYLQLQTLRLDLNGKPKLQGNIFAPLSLSKLQVQGDWLAALSDDSNLDLDLTLDPVDLAELTSALMTTPTAVSGQASGSVELHGTPAAFQGKSALHLRDFVFGNEPRLSVELETHMNQGTLTGKATAAASGSDPVSLEASVPLRLEKRDDVYVLNTDGPLSATLDFPAIFLSRLPRYLSSRTFVDGILSGRITIFDSLRNPQVHGTAQLIKGRLLGRGSLSTSITFGGQTAAIDFAELAYENVRSVARGEIDFRRLTGVMVKIRPSAPVFGSAPADQEECIGGIEVLPAGAHPLFTEGGRGQRINEIDLGGSLFSRDWTISLKEKRTDDPLDALLEGGISRAFPICAELQPSGKMLTLGLVERSFLDGTAAAKQRRRRK